MSHENPKKQSQFQMWMKSSHESWMNESEMETLQLHSFATHNCLVEFIFWLGIKLNVLLSHFQVLKNKLWGWPWPKWGVIYHAWLKRNNKRNGEIIWTYRILVLGSLKKGYWFYPTGKMQLLHSPLHFSLKKVLKSWGIEDDH